VTSALRFGRTIKSVQWKARDLRLPVRSRRRKPKAKWTNYVDGPPVAELRKAMQPETAAQSEIWAGVQFTDHPAAARPEGKLRGLPDSARSMVGCSAALAASN
jgi:hypothetical protein